MSINTTQEFLVDQFLLEVGEGRMPSEHSPEAEAYQEWRMAEIKESFDSGAEKLRRRIESFKRSHRV